jgi:hypothetical protein
MTAGWATVVPRRVAVATLLVILGTCAACGSTPGPSPTTASTAAPTNTSGPPGDVECAIAQPPGPADEPPRQGTEIDTTNDGPGRWRLCLTGPIALSVEDTAWCRWDAARTTVDEVTGLPASDGAVDYDAWLSFPAAAFEVHLTDNAHGGVIANYLPRAGLSDVTPGVGRTDGTAPIDVVLVADGGSAPAGAPPTLVGRLVWDCGDPPAKA